MSGVALSRSLRNMINNVDIASMSPNANIMGRGIITSVEAKGKKHASEKIHHSENCRG